MQIRELISSTVIVEKSLIMLATRVVNVAWREARETFPRVSYTCWIYSERRLL